MSTSIRRGGSPIRTIASLSWRRSSGAAGNAEIANRLEDPSQVVRVGGDPDIHIHGVPDIAEGVYGITADQHEPRVMGIERLQELFEIAWYPGRRHS